MLSKRGAAGLAVAAAEPSEGPELMDDAQVEFGNVMIDVDA